MSVVGSIILFLSFFFTLKKKLTLFFFPSLCHYVHMWLLILVFLLFSLCSDASKAKIDGDVTINVDDNSNKDEETLLQKYGIHSEETTHLTGKLTINGGTGKILIHLSSLLYVGSIEITNVRETSAAIFDSLLYVNGNFSIRSNSASGHFFKIGGKFASRAKLNNSVT